MYRFSANEQKKESIEILNHVADSKLLAEKAVRDGDDTLKKANNTYHLLQSFQSEVQKSSESAGIALKNVPQIEAQMKETQEIVQQTEQVMKKNFH